MDSDHEDDHDHDDGHQEEPKRSATVTGFLFGNVNEKGELESDVLDEVKDTLLGVPPGMEL